MTKVIDKLSGVVPYLYNQFLAVKDTKDRSSDTAYLNEDAELVLNLENPEVQKKILHIINDSVTMKEYLAKKQK